MELVPCVHCRRHVGVSETMCPFCRRAASPQRPQFAFAGKLTRAAIFSAAVVGCDPKTAKPTPAPVPQQTGSATGSGSDDLEKMLDADQRTVDHPAPVSDGGTLDAETVAATTDAGTGSGAVAKTPEEIRDRKEMIRKDAERAQERLRKRQLEQQKVLPDERVQHNAKPYGAPPARRRVV